MHQPLRIESHSGLLALERYAAQMDALNLSSARPNPYSSAGFLRCFARHNEYFPDSDAIRLYTVWEQDRLIGCLPLRKVQDRFGPLRRSRICFLVPYDVERPGLLSSPENEERVARALVLHLRDHEADFDMLEFVGQPPASPLYQAMHQAADARFRVRDIEIQPFNEIPLSWPDTGAYFRSLSPSWRSSVARYSRKLLGAGTPEVVFAEGAQAASAWFDAFLELESRSWKHGSSAAIARHAHRLALYRQVMSGQGGFVPSFVGILIDGVLVAGTLNGSSSDAPRPVRGSWNFEITHDASYADLSPGLLLLLLTVHAALQRQESFLNLLNGFSYYKQHWKAELVPVRNVQLIRRRSLHNLRGTAGDLMRQLRRSLSRPPGQARGPQDRDGGDSAPRPQARPDRSQARAAATRALAYEGPGIQRLARAQLCALLPFDTRPATPPDSGHD